MRILLVLGCSLLLAACQGLNSEKYILDRIITGRNMLVEQANGEQLLIENEITYIEMLVSLEEMQAAKQALNELLFSLNHQVENPLQKARLNTLIVLLENIESENAATAERFFTGTDAIAIVKDAFGQLDDVLYVYHRYPSQFGTYGIGYHVALKSISLLESDQESDGIILKLFVSEDGQIVELERR